MKTLNTVLVATCALLVGATGCGKKEEPPAPPATPPSASQQPASPVKTAVDAAQAQTQVVKEQAKEATTTVQAQATNVQTQAAAAMAKAQGLIDQAQTFIAEKKWSEALTSLNQLTGQKLTTEQQSLVQRLKEQAQKALEAVTKAAATNEAAKAIGGLVPTQK